MIIIDTVNILYSKMSSSSKLEVDECWDYLWNHQITTVEGPLWKCQLLGNETEHVEHIFDL